MLVSNIYFTMFIETVYSSFSLTLTCLTWYDLAAKHINGEEKFEKVCGNARTFNYEYKFIMQ
jgi:hypothetical protein